MKKILSLLIIICFAAQDISFALAPESVFNHSSKASSERVIVKLIETAIESNRTIGKGSILIQGIAAILRRNEKWLLYNNINYQVTPGESLIRCRADRVLRYFDNTKLPPLAGSEAEVLGAVSRQFVMKDLPGYKVPSGGAASGSGESILPEEIIEIHAIGTEEGSRAKQGYAYLLIDTSGGGEILDVSLMNPDIGSFYTSKHRNGRTVLLQVNHIKGSIEIYDRDEAVTDSAVAVAKSLATRWIETYRKEGVSDKSKNLISAQKTDIPTAISGGILNKIYVEDDMAVNSVVCPDDKPVRAVYGGAGTDISNFLLSTNAAQGVFIARYKGLKQTDLEKGRPILAYCRDRLPVNADYIVKKRQAGYAANTGVGWGIRQIVEQIVFELAFLGVKDFAVRTDGNGRPEIVFMWTYPGRRARERVIKFVDEDVTKADKYADVLIEPIDLYYQRAAENIPADYTKSDCFINKIADSMKEGGYFVTDDYATAYTYATKPAEFPIEFPEVAVPGRDGRIEPIYKLRYHPAFNEGEGPDSLWFHYGWRVTVRQKTTSRAEASKTFSSNGAEDIEAAIDKLNRITEEAVTGYKTPDKDLSNFVYNYNPLGKGPYWASSYGDAAMLLSYAGANEGDTILDVGHGAGDTISLLAHLFKLRAKGIEIVPEHNQFAVFLRDLLVKKGYLKKDQVVLENKDFMDTSIDFSNYDFIYYFCLGTNDKKELLSKLLTVKIGAKILMYGDYEPKIEAKLNKDNGFIKEIWGKDEFFSKGKARIYTRVGQPALIPLKHGVVVADRLCRADLADRPIADDERIILSESLFTDDSAGLEQVRLALASILNKPGSHIEILNEKDMMERVTNAKSSKNKIAAILSQEDIDKNHNWKDPGKAELIKATVLIAGDKLTDANYLYLTGLIGYARAVMTGDRDRVVRYYKLLTGKDLDPDVLGMLDMSDSKNTILFAIKAILKFRPIVKIDPAKLNDLRIAMENFLISA